MKQRCCCCLEQVAPAPPATSVRLQHLPDDCFLVRFIGCFDPTDLFDSGWVVGYHDIDSFYPNGEELCVGDTDAYLVV